LYLIGIKLDSNEAQLSQVMIMSLGWQSPVTIVHERQLQLACHAFFVDEFHQDSLIV